MRAKVEMHPADAPQVKPLCVVFHRWSNKEKTVLFAPKGKTRGYGKESRNKGGVKTPPISHRPAMPVGDSLSAATILYNTTTNENWAQNENKVC